VAVAHRRGGTSVAVHRRRRAALPQRRVRLPGRLHGGLRGRPRARRPQASSRR